MVKLWAKVEFTNGDTTYAPGDPVDLPRETDEQRAFADGLLSRGVLTQHEPAAVKRAKTEESGEGRTGRTRRS